MKPTHTDAWVQPRASCACTQVLPLQSSPTLFSPAERSLSRRNTRRSLTPGCMWPHVSHSSGTSREGQAVAELGSSSGKERTCRARAETTVRWLPPALRALCCSVLATVVAPSAPLRGKGGRKVILLILHFYT